MTYILSLLQSFTRDERRVRRGASWRAGLRLASAAVAVALVTAGCTSENGDDADGTPGDSDTPAGAGSSDDIPELTYGIDRAPSSVNPALESDQRHLWTLAYEPLLHVTADGSLEPGLATSWGYVDDQNTVFELTLREDAQFSDGTPVTAEAVKTWFEYYQGAGGAFANRIQIESIETDGEYTVRLHLADPNPTVPIQLADGWTWGLVASPAAVADPDVLDSQTFGAGPYVLDPDETIEGDQYTFVPNEHYYDQSKIRFSKVTAKIVTDPTSRLQAVITGQLQAAIGSASEAEAAADAGLDVVSAPVAGSELIIIDREGTFLEPFGDVRVRQALNYAVNREAIAEGLGLGFAEPISQHFTVDGWDPEYQDFYQYDPDKARSLLAEAGYADGFDFQIPVLTGTDAESHALAVAQDFEAIGVRMEILPVGDVNSFLDEMHKAIYPAMYLVRTPYMPQEVDFDVLGEGFIYDEFDAGRPPELEGLLNDALSAEDPSVVYQEMSRVITEQAWFVPVLQVERMWFVDPSISGVEFGNTKLAPLPTDWFPAE